MATDANRTDRVEGGARKKEHLPQETPLISIITPTFNSRDTLECSIRSVLDKKNQHIEYLIIDGKSTDGTIELLKEIDDRVDYWVSEPDQGIYDAINKGIRTARGDWIYILGSDDLLLDLESVIPYLKDPNTVYYGNVLMKEKGKIYDGKFSSFRLARKNICQQAIFYPNTVFHKYSYSMEFPVLADWEFNMKCHNDKAIPFCYLPVTIALYDDSRGISSRTIDKRFFEKALSLRKKYFPRWIYALFLIRSKLVSLLVLLGVGEYMETILYRTNRK